MNGTNSSITFFSVDTSCSSKFGGNIQSLTPRNRPEHFGSCAKSAWKAQTAQLFCFSIETSCSDKFGVKNDPSASVSLVTQRHFQQMFVGLPATQLALRKTCRFGRISARVAPSSRAPLMRFLRGFVHNYGGHAPPCCVLGQYLVKILQQIRSRRSTRQL